MLKLLETSSTLSKKVDIQTTLINNKKNVVKNFFNSN